MFENTASFEDTLDHAGALSDSAELRAFAWPELVARLAAARDLRLVLDTVAGADSGSFLHAADAISGFSDDPQSISERPINLVGLSGGKARPALSANAVSDAAHDDREAL